MNTAFLLMAQYDAMAVIPILRYPDAGLRQPCAPVTSFDDAFRLLVNPAWETP